MEGKNVLAYKSERTPGGNKNGDLPGEARGNHFPLCRQHDHLLLPPKAGRQAATVQCHLKTLPGALPQKKNFRGHKMGAIRVHEGGQFKSLGIRPRRLYPASGAVPSAAREVCTFLGPSGGHVQLPGQPSVGSVRFSLAPCQSSGVQCTDLQSSGNGESLCEPTLDHHSSVASAPKGGEKRAVLAGLPLLGFRTMVAPVNKATHTKDAMFFDRSIRRDVCELSAAAYEKAKVAPSLSSVVRSCLEQQKMPPEVAKTFIQANNSSILRYDSAFRLLWGELLCRNVNPADATVNDVAASIAKIFFLEPCTGQKRLQCCSASPRVWSFKMSPLVEWLQKEVESIFTEICCVLGLQSNFATVGQCATGAIPSSFERKAYFAAAAFVLAQICRFVQDLEKRFFV